MATYNFLVIGGGSAGIASARRAAQFGAKCAVIERAALGGTCVNVGCVPKKVMFNTALHAEALHDAAQYGFNVTQTHELNLAMLKDKRDAYIRRLNGIYAANLDKSNVERIEGSAKFVGPKQVQVGDRTITADHILIGVGGRPSMPRIPGIEHCINSDGFFELTQIPKKVAVVGAGYIAVEMCGILKSLGSDASIFIRGERVLRAFDETISEVLTEEMKTMGINFVTGAQVTAVEKTAEGLSLHLKDGSVHGGFDVCLQAIGRESVAGDLDLATAGVNVNERGDIPVDDYQNTNVAGVYAVGDVTGKAQLTPVAIAAGRKLAHRLFNNEPESRLDYSNIPTVVFSHPSPIGTCGMTEAEAKAQFGAENIKVYRSGFTNLFFSMLDRKPKSVFKLIVQLPTERVVGIHIIGMGADEIMQGFGVAMKMGATKADLDSCVAIHPTAAEELVTLT